MFQIPSGPNESLEQGAWAPYRDSEFRIAYANNNKFQRVMQRLQKPHRRKIERNEMDPAEMKSILIQALAEAVLLDWRKVVDASGNEVPFSKELALKSLKYDEEFRDFVMEVSSDIANFKADEEEHEGNS